MQYVQIDGTCLRLSRLAFGTATLHHLPLRGQRLRLLNEALGAGVTHFDTSPYYGYGLGESDLGLLMQGRREAITVATKVGLYPPGGAAATGVVAVWARKAGGRVYRKLSAPRIDWSIRAAEESLTRSLRRLRTQYVDILFLHEPDPTLIESDEFLTWLDRERTKGRVRYWGLAGAPSQFREWLVGNHPLSTVLQSRDSLSQKEADLILSHGRRLQITYGYLSDSLHRAEPKRPEVVLLEALQRNCDGTVLFSTRRLNRLVRLARVAS